MKQDSTTLNKQLLIDRLLATGFYKHPDGRQLYECSEADLEAILTEQLNMQTSTTFQQQRRKKTKIPLRTNKGFQPKVLI